MRALSELTLQTSYHKGRDNIAEAFYLPCMRRATEYDRAVGYFRSTAFIIAWPALREFVQNRGKIRVLCSQVLASDDIDALDKGYSARVDEAIGARFLEEVRILLRDEILREPARILAALVASGTIELQIAVLREPQVRAASGRIFHDKLGIFRDDSKNLVIFKGSMNETWTGLAADGNLESVDVAASWMGSRDLERARTEEKYFSELWSNQYPTLTVRPFPDVARTELVDAADPDWEGTLSRLIQEPGSGQIAKTPVAALFAHTKRPAWRRGQRMGGGESWRSRPGAGRLSLQPLRFARRSLTTAKSSSLLSPIKCSSGSGTGNLMRRSLERESCGPVRGIAHGRRACGYGLHLVINHASVLATVQTASTRISDNG